MRTQFTITNVTVPSKPFYVGHYSAWHDVPGSIESARATMKARLADLRTAFPHDRFQSHSVVIGGQAAFTSFDLKL